MATEKIDNQNSQTASALAFTAWAIVLLAVFLVYRGPDVGRLPTLLGASSGGEIFGVAGFRDSAVGMLAAGIITLSWLGLGNLILGRIKPERNENHSHALELVMSIACGAAAWSIIWFFLGAVGLYGKGSAAIAAGVGLALAAMSIRRLREFRIESRVPERSSGLEKLLIALVALPVTLALIASLAPPVAKDTLLYHFAVPKAFITQGSSAFIGGNIASFLALGSEMHAVWAMLLGGFISVRSGEAAAGVTLFVFFPVVIAGVFGWARELDVSRSGALIAALVTASVPTAFYVASSGYIDLAMALFTLLAAYALSRWWRSLDRDWLILMAILLGGALATKLTAVFVFAAFALVILLRARQQQDVAAKIVGGGAAALFLAMVLASPWYLRTWMATGSPVFPFYMNIWKGSAAGWDVERSNLFQAMNSNYGGESKDVMDYVMTPFSTAYLAQPEIAELYDGVIGIAFLMGLPVLIYGLWRSSLSADIRIISGVVLISFLFWLFTSQQLRYLLPVLPLLALAIVAAAESISRSRQTLRNVFGGGLTLAALVGSLVSIAWFFQRSPMRVVLGGESRDQYLSRKLDYFPYYQVLNTQSAPDAKVWLINMRRDTYNLERPYFSDYIFEDWTLRKMVWESKTIDELRAKTAGMGIQYILARLDVLLDYDKSVLVDDSKPRRENEAKLLMARDLVADPARTIKADSKFSLARIF